jgi:hypothetical protein
VGGRGGAAPPPPPGTPPTPYPYPPWCVRARARVHTRVRVRGRMRARVSFSARVLSLAYRVLERIPERVLARGRARVLVCALVTRVPRSAHEVYRPYPYRAYTRARVTGVLCGYGYGRVRKRAGLRAHTRTLPPDPVPVPTLVRVHTRAHARRYGYGVGCARVSVFQHACYRWLIVYWNAYRSVCWHTCSHTQFTHSSCASRSSVTARVSSMSIPRARRATDHSRPMVSITRARSRGTTT